jgi:cardiolipin synthase
MARSGSTGAFTRSLLSLRTREGRLRWAGVRASRPTPIDSPHAARYIGRRVMTTRILTPSNQITLLRLVFVPVFAILVLDQSYRAALAVLVAAAISDVLDGTVARLLKQVSPLGVALDPIADKILMTTAYLTLAFRDALPWWLTILVLSRDVAIILTALLISLVAGYRPFYPSYLGKASTVVQVATVFAAVSYQAHVPYITAKVVTVFVYLAAALTLASGIHYLIVVRQRYGHPQVAAPAEPSLK